MSSAGKKKIAVLGGGMSALSAAFYLTSRSDWQSRYEVTIYQRGWRLGGKAASGRNMARGARVEGLGAVHVWGGSYENAFSLMRDCYAELGRPAGATFRGWEDAFSEQPMLYFEEILEDGSTSVWPLDFPVTSDTPGDGKDGPSIWSVIERLTGWLVEAMRNFPLTTARDTSREALAKDTRRLLPAWLVELSRDVGRVAGKLIYDGSPFWLLREAWELSHRLLTNEESFASDMVMLADYLRKFLDWLEDNFLEEIMADSSARRVYTLMALAIAVVRGLITDNVLFENFFVIDDFDLRQWLARHGASEFLCQSAPVKAIYDFFFAYRHGDADSPLLSAGIALNHTLKLIMAYKGSIFWKLNAGAGSVVFAPLYEVLKARGVKFEFFTEVEALRLDANFERVARIELAHQAEVVSGASYEPLIEVQDLSCWPNQPLWTQLVDGARYEQEQVNFEARAEDGGWTPVSRSVLELGRDFDMVICAMSVGALPYVASDIIANKRGWDAMVDQLETVPAVSMRLDFLRDRLALGWRQTSALLSGWESVPFTSWEDCTAWLNLEDWPLASSPRNIATYCGTYATALSTAGQSAQIKAWLDDRLGQIFPHTMSGPTTFDYDLLCAPDGVIGEDRLDAQWIHRSQSPSDHFVLSLPRRSRFRLSADTSGYDNLVLAGDWLYTGMGGTMESAVMAGMMASRALCDLPQRIAWEVTVYPWQRERCIRSLYALEEEDPSPGDGNGAP